MRKFMRESTGVWKAALLRKKKPPGMPAVLDHPGGKRHPVWFNAYKEKSYRAVSRNWRGGV